MKTIASIEDIRSELQRRIHASTWGNGYCTDCTAPFPYRLLHDAFDYSTDRPSDHYGVITDVGGD